VFVIWGDAFFTDRTLKPSLVHSAQIATESYLLRSAIVFIEGVLSVMAIFVRRNKPA
jgi:hypothetical protein